MTFLLGGWGKGSRGGGSDPRGVGADGQEVRVGRGCENKNFKALA